ncbi:MAG TPA: GNAT family N-acetyltransferase [candidate division Zixibacteria bacterium]|nr:GNAT family N-acetyltransferase [candidate division Zixibacteria bacterium]
MQTESRLISLLTDRLVLRELEPADTDAIFDLLGDPVAMRYFPKTYSREEAVEWIERNQRRYRIFGYGLWAVVLRETGEVLGNCGPTWHEINDELQLEVGYHFRRLYWGNGYATEAARAVIEWCFENIPVDHVISLIRSENKTSRRVAERNGLFVAGSAMFHGMEHLVYRMERGRWVAKC